LANPAALGLLGHQREEDLLGQPSEAVIRIADGQGRDPALSPVEEARRTGAIRGVEARLVRTDGRTVLVDYDATPVRMGTSVGVALAFRDLSARSLAEGERRRHDVEEARSAEGRASHARVAEAEWAERRRIARDLHDGAQQRLVNAVVALQVAQRQLRAGTLEAEPLLAEGLAHARAAIRELRELASGIHPAALCRAGLAGALPDLADRAPCPVFLDVSAERYPAPVEAAAYFLVAEALTNVAKHADAGMVRLTAGRMNGHLVVEVSDDGRGGAGPGSGAGLCGLADRVAALGGRLSLHSPPGRGTRLRAELPVAARDAQTNVSST
jgi:PAS domain S-box-containing protein